MRGAGGPVLVWLGLVLRVLFGSPMIPAVVSATLAAGGTHVARIVALHTAAHTFGATALFGALLAGLAAGFTRLFRALLAEIAAALARLVRGLKAGGRALARLIRCLFGQANLVNEILLAGIGIIDHFKDEIIVDLVLIRHGSGEGQQCQQEYQ